MENLKRLVAHFCRKKMKVIVAAVFAEVLIVEQHREGLEALTQHRRRTEVCEGLHEDHECGGEDRRHGQIQDDLEQTFDADAAHIGGGLHQGVVDALERTVHVNEHQREELQRLRQGDTAEAVDARKLDSEGGLEELGDDAGAAQKHDPGVRTEKRGGHAAQNADDEENLCALQPVEGIEICKRNPDDQGHEGHEEGDLKAVDDCLRIIALTEELLEL